MKRPDRNKHKKHKVRQERLRQEKHLRRSQRRTPSEGEDRDLDAPAERFRPPSIASQLAHIERTVQERHHSILAALAVEGEPGGIEPNTPVETGPAEGPSEQPLDNFFKGEPAQKWLEALLAETSRHPFETLHVPLDLPPELVLRASVCCEILVAAEVIAAGIGRPSPHLPPEVAAWLLETEPLFTPGLVKLAATAVRQVGEHSELRHLWDAVNLSQEWLKGVDDLYRRLQA
jgi:hypothetical protein